MRSSHVTSRLARHATVLVIVPLALLAGACRDVEQKQPAATASRGGEVARTWSPSSVSAVSGVPVEAVRTAIDARVAGARPKTLDEDHWLHVRRLYKHYGRGPLWFNEDGIDQSRASALMKALGDAHSDALRIEEFPLGELGSALSALRATKQPTAQQLADADVMLTASYAALSEDLLTGQVEPKSVSQEWHINPKEEDVDSALVRAIEIEPLDRSIAQMRPPDADYEALRKELARLREVTAKQPTWPTVPAGPALKPGASDNATRIAALRDRLRAEGFITSTEAPVANGRAVYDRALAGAVAEYQALHAIDVDSILGPGTVQSLNVPPTFRLGQIAANLERLRWMPRSLGSRYIVVNVPAFRLEAYDNGQKTLEMKTIVGQSYEDKATPTFSDTMKFVVFRPYWNVTDDIANKEIWPKVNADPGYLEANNYETFQESGQTRIRQKPGEKNSLGLVKFMFPNDYNIYLHDTPNHELFDKDVRAFSHGCIRVEKPSELAQFVLGWSADSVQSQMRQGADDLRVNTPRAIPVFIVYTTAFQRDGRIHYGNDLYHRDDSLVKSMAGAATPGPQAMKAAAALLQLANR